ISSSALSRFRETQKEALAEKFSKSSQRDMAQALANGGAAALCIIGYTLTHQPAWWAAFAASLAAANADTWATELGVLSRTPPRLITNGKIVEVGTSGGVSLLGTQAAFSGSLLVAIIAYLAALFDPTLSVLRPSASPLLTTVAFAGLLGSLFDSLLGAAVQAIYYCDQCQKETERHPLHRCGAQTRMFRGRGGWITTGSIFWRRRWERCWRLWHFQGSAANSIPRRHRLRHHRFSSPHPQHHHQCHHHEDRRDDHDVVVVAAGQLHDPAVYVRAGDGREGGEEIVQPGVRADAGGVGHIDDHGKRVIGM
ncbi:MAG TPA: DUF92 domain-containing protein, partial [Anaerolineales bacterium]|nr:DUF92 domain-containing protein [Anaerolineales bacterium]